MIAFARVPRLCVEIEMALCSTQVQKGDLTLVTIKYKHDDIVKFRP